MMLVERPVLCLVTDRRRLVPAAADFETTRRRLVELARQAVDAGVHLIQVRERGLETSALAALVTSVMDVARGSTSRILVNDRLDVALACGANGVHLPADSLPPTLTRSISPPQFLIGRSVHGVDEAAAYGGSVDYLIAGTVFPTSSKPGTARLLGLDGLAAVARATTTPVLAIGGVTKERLPSIAASGAAGIAAIGLFVAMPMSEVVAAARSAFDITKGAS
jgi:thiamine-phosphate diphosphorylase